MSRQQNFTKISRQTIAESKQRLDIVDVISENIDLRKRRKDWAGLCSFHQEKILNFSVSPTEQMYYSRSSSTGSAGRMQP